MPEPAAPVWYRAYYNSGLEFLQPANALLASVPLAMYGYGLLGLLILAAMLVRYRKMKAPSAPAGKRRRRQKKASTYYYLKNSAAKGDSNISADPFL